METTTSGRFWSVMATGFCLEKIRVGTSPRAAERAFAQCVDPPDEVTNKAGVDGSSKKRFRASTSGKKSRKKS